MRNSILVCSQKFIANILFAILHPLRNYPKRFHKKLIAVSCITFSIIFANIAISEHGPQDILKIIHKDGRIETYTREDLEKIEQISFRSSSPWMEGVHDFTGIPLLSLVQLIDPFAVRLEMTARDDYQVTFSTEDLTETWPILALTIDGNPISPRTKGPYWVVYPFDDNPDLQREDIYALSIWQVQFLKFE